MTSQPIWDSSVLTNTRYRATDDIGLMVGKGSIFELNEIRPSMGIRPAHCTVHLYGTTLKMYITKPLFEAVKDKLELVND